MLLGARPAELRLSWGYRSWAAAAPYLLLGGAMAAVRIATGGLSMSYHLPRVLVFSRNGFTEEFLFRGALQTRLASLMGDGWGLVLSSLTFGVLHVGAAAALLGGDFLVGLALCVASHAPAGLLFGLTALRTRSLIAPTVAHIALNLASVVWTGA